MLDQTFTPRAPNEVWVTDITYIPTEEGWLYLAGVKDVFTCEIVGYAMAGSMTQELTGRAIFLASQQKRPAAGLIHHSDRGSQYCAHDYRKLIKQFGMVASMSRRGNCYDNAPMESFWGSLKNGWCHLIIVRICLPRVSGWNRMRNHKFQQEVQDDRTFQIFLP